MASSSQAEYSKKLIGQFAAQILDEGMKASPDQGVVDMINLRIQQIDELMSDQLNAIMHAPEFQALEASWARPAHMVMNTETSTRLKLRLLNVTKKELLRDLEKAVDHDQSQLFKKIYEENTAPSCNPYSLMIGDYYFGRHPQDILLLDKLSKVASARMRRSSRRRPRAVRHEDLDRSGRTRDLSKIFESANSTAGVHSGTARIRGTSRYVCRATRCACLMARRPFRWRTSSSRKTSTGATTAGTVGECGLPARHAHHRCVRQA